MDGECNASAKIPNFKGYVFFLPISVLIKEFWGETALERAYEESPDRNPSWPSFRSLNRWALAKNSALPSRPSSLRSISMMEGDLKRLFGYQPPDVLWRPHCEWSSFLANGLFEDPRATKLWKERLERDKSLGCMELPRVAGKARLDVLIQSPLAEELGTPGCATRLQAVDWPEELQACVDLPAFVHNRLADTFSCLLRLLAWVVVDRSLAHWPRIETAGLEQAVLLESLIPRFDGKSGLWSRSLSTLLMELAQQCGSDGSTVPSAYLGNQWSKTRQWAIEHTRTLRKWEQVRPPKPHSGKINELLNSLSGELNQRGDPWQGTLVRHYQFRFAWLMGELLYRLQHEGLSNPILVDIFSTYREEYMLARVHLGKPLN